MTCAKSGAGNSHGASFVNFLHASSKLIFLWKNVVGVAVLVVAVLYVTRSFLLEITHNPHMGYDKILIYMSNLLAAS